MTSTASPRPRARARARRRHPTATVVRTRRLTRRRSQVVVGAVGDVGPDLAEPVDGRVEGGGVDGLEADGNRVVGRPGLHHEPLGPIVVAPGERAGGRLAGDEADDIGQHGRERVGLRKLEDEVAELDLVVHREVLSGGRSAVSGRRRAGGRAVRCSPAARRSASRAGRRRRRAARRPSRRRSRE